MPAALILMVLLPKKYDRDLFKTERKAYRKNRLIEKKSVDKVAKKPSDD